jgi:hypothetical protein
MRRAATGIFLSLLAALLACSASPLNDEAGDVGSTEGASSSSSSSSSSGGGQDPADAGSSPAAPPSASSSSSGGTPVGSSGADAGGSPVSHPGADAGPAPKDAGSSSPAPRNGSCTPLSQQNGTAVDTTHGRLDGTLVYVLGVDGSSSCNGDSAHVHLQIEVGSSVYDVAVDVGKSGDEVGWYQETLAVPGGAWSEGWHGSDGLGYGSLGLASSAFATLDPATMATTIESLVASTSKISIFCTGYTPGDNGCHDVHYQDGSSQDGAIVLDPTAATSPVLFFRFTDQSF